MSSKQPYIKQKLSLLGVGLGITMYGVGMLFKIMHWPMAKEMLIIGSVSVVLSYLCRFLFKQTKQLTDYLKLALVMLYVVSVVLRWFRLNGQDVVASLLWVVIIALYVYSVYLFYKHNQPVNVFNCITINIFFLPSLIALQGLLLKLIHLPYAKAQLYSGAVLFVLAFVADFIIKQFQNPIKQP